MATKTKTKTTTDKTKKATKAGKTNGEATWIESIRNSSA